MWGQTYITPVSMVWNSYIGPNYGIKTANHYIYTSGMILGQHDVFCFGLIAGVLMLFDMLI